MYIYAISPLKSTHNNLKINNNQPYHIGSIALNEEDKPQSSDARAIYAYRDYAVNLSFAGRNPEDFYSQDFVKDNMPKTMKAYITQNPEVTHSHGIKEAVAPAQIMAESFNKLRNCVTVDDVKRVFPDEELFAELKEPNYKATQGIFNKIGLVRELLEESNVPQGKRTLFQNGLDNPIIYVLRKKYIECKTDKEIQTDIARDINPAFEMAAKEDGIYFPYSSLHNLGVKNPELPFWNSLINTRDDYAHAYRDRVQVEGGKFVDAEEAERRYGVSRKPKTVYDSSKNKYKPNTTITEEIGNIIANSETLNASETKNNIRRGRITKNTSELTFVQKYWSEIMSVAVEKVHLSDEMIQFNVKRAKLKANSNYEKLNINALNEFIDGTQQSTNLSKSEMKTLSTTMKEFWKERPTLKEHFAQSISDTIKEFAQAYGENGNNAEFEFLLDYAHSIKPLREGAKALHNTTQAEYEKLSRVVPEVIQNRLEFKAPINVENRPIPPDFHAVLDNGTVVNMYPRDYQPDDKKNLYIADIDDFSIRLNRAPELDAIEVFKEESPLFPERFIKARLNDIKALLGKNYDKFCVSVMLHTLDKDYPLKKFFYTEKQITDIIKSTNETDIKQRGATYQKLKLALMDWGYRKGLLAPEDIELRYKSHSIVRYAILEKMAKKDMKIKDIEDATKFADKKISEYSKPLSSSEKNKICIEAISFIKKNYNNLNLNDFNLNQMYTMSNKIITQDKQGANDFKAIINETISRADFMQKNDCGIRYLFEKDSIEALKNSELDLLFKNVFSDINKKELTDFFMKYRQYILK